jgi:hypothetical protein
MKVIYKIYVRDLVEILSINDDLAYQEVLVKLSIANNEYNTEEEAIAALEDYMSWGAEQGSEYTILKFYRK